VVHDAVRPCIDRASLSRLLRELDGHPVGGLLGIPVADTLKRVDAQSRAIRTERRESLWRAQTPQMFRLAVLRKAFACPGIEHWTDEAHAVEDFGENPLMVVGSETNIKITFAEDLILASAILAADKDVPAAIGGAPEGSSQAISLATDHRSVSRIGFGQDSHRFSAEPDRKLIIGGIAVPHSSGLEANSDGDVVLHALCRALEQAVGRHSFSEYADNMSRRGIKDSREYVKVARSHVAEAGYRIGNVGLSIEARTPRIDPLAAQMKEVIATLLGVSPDAIGINATTGEDLTPFGKGEGIQAFAIVNLNA
jgi:2-C-methyl-D-erythritol 2,4-cyclodiphosphate synthase